MELKEFLTREVEELSIRAKAAAGLGDVNRCVEHIREFRIIELLGNTYSVFRMAYGENADFVKHLENKKSEEEKVFLGKLKAEGAGCFNSVKWAGSDRYIKNCGDMITLYKAYLNERGEVDGLSKNNQQG